MTETTTPKKPKPRFVLDLERERKLLLKIGRAIDGYPLATIENALDRVLHDVREEIAAAAAAESV